jgi:hypothetical protein
MRGLVAIQAEKDRLREAQAKAEAEMMQQVIKKKKKKEQVYFKLLN